MTKSYPAFARYIGIDYSGAETPTTRLGSLRVYCTDRGCPPIEQEPLPAQRKHWSRRGIAQWLVEQLSDNVPTLVGIDHGFSFPLRYFETHGLLPDWPSFLDDFQRHWPTDEDLTYVDFVRDGSVGNGAARDGNARWRRLTEERAGGAKSVFHFDVPGSVAKSTHAGIPWLRFIRNRLRGRVHFWPFDGWDIPIGCSAIVEAYPALWSHGFPRQDRNSDQHDAYTIAEWFRRSDLDGSLKQALHPQLSVEERRIASVEGWIIGSDQVRETVSSRRGPAKSKPRAKQGKSTTTPGYINKHRQIVLRKTDKPGTDHNQRVYVLCCMACDHVYGANGSDIWQRRCPSCGGGAPGLEY